MSHITEQKCPNCGAPMRFDPASGMLVCDNCGNKVDVSEKPSVAAAATPPEESEFAGLDFNTLQAQAIDPDAEDLPIYNCVSCGAEVIAHAMTIVSEEDTGYLKEAMNLAHYHHEKWNGKGYPEGLKGEEIPLSARIMAVADVFDALVSKRSYKDGFPFEKAMAIIEEGSGSHFDPKVAGAFINASDEVRVVMNTNMDIR